MLASYARVVHQEPVISPSRWPEWRRLEAVLNLALSHHDTWALCAYDRRTLTDEMVADLHATHPLHCPGRQPPAQRPLPTPVQAPQAAPKLPAAVERTAPAVELADPSPAAARATVSRFAPTTGCPPVRSTTWCSPSTRPSPTP